MKKILLKNKKNGFTVIEIVVVLFIFSALTSVVLFRYRDFDRRVTTDTTVQSIALLFHKAQNQAISGRFPTLVQNVQTVPSLDWKPSYGIFIPDGGTQREVYFFYDTDGDQIPNDIDKSQCVSPTVPTECLDYFELPPGTIISSICLETGGSCVPISNVSVVFTRPFPDASIHYGVSIPGVSGTVATDTIKIGVTSDTATKYIRISPLGNFALSSE